MPGGEIVLGLMILLGVCIMIKFFYYSLMYPRKDFVKERKYTLRNGVVVTYRFGSLRIPVEGSRARKNKIVGVLNFSPEFMTSDLPDPHTDFFKYKSLKKMLDEHPAFKEDWDLIINGKRYYFDV